MDSVTEIETRVQLLLRNDVAQVTRGLQRRQLVLADNPIALNAGWDLAMQNLELKDLSGLGTDLSLLGFTAKELATALNGGNKVGWALREDQQRTATKASRSRNLVGWP